MEKWPEKMTQLSVLLMERTDMPATIQVLCPFSIMLHHNTAPPWEVGDCKLNASKSMVCQMLGSLKCQPQNTRNCQRWEVKSTQIILQLQSNYQKRGRFS